MNQSTLMLALMLALLGGKNHPATARMRGPSFGACCASIFLPRGSSALDLRDQQKNAGYTRVRLA
jgi:hypothetical protein